MDLLCKSLACKTKVEAPPMFGLLAETGAALLLNFPGDIQFDFLAIDVEDVRVMPLNGNFRYLIYRNIPRVAVGLRARCEAIVRKINHILGLNGVMHGVFIAQQFRGNIGFRSSFYLRFFPITRLRQARSRNQQRQHQKTELFHRGSSAEYVPFLSLPLRPRKSKLRGSATLGNA